MFILSLCKYKAIKRKLYLFLKNHKKFFNNVITALKKIKYKLRGYENERMNFEIEPTKTKRIFVFELPCFDNLGDHAIAYAAKIALDNFCKENTEYKLFVIPSKQIRDDIFSLKKTITAKDIIVCQGGGNMGSLYEFAESI